MTKNKARTKKATLGIILALLTGVIVLGFLTLQKIALWTDSNRLVVQNPLQVGLQRPVRVEKRELARPVVQYVSTEGESLEFETDIEKYICEKFGQDCLTALAVAEAESGMREDALNSNDGSPRNVDVGVFQINLKYHEHREGCSLGELTDPYKNVDCAYQIYQEQGFEPWVAYQRGMHLAFLSN